MEPRMEDFRPDNAVTSPYATAPSSPRGRRVLSDEGGAGGGPFLTAPSSPNPFDLLPPAATPRLTGANPFDLFQHFTSAPASPRRAAAIYAHFADGNGSSDGGRDGDGDDGDSDGDEEFQPRRSYATGGGSSVPFDWEERPGTPKRGLAGGVAANEAAWDTEFEFGTHVGSAAPAETLTAADELFEKGKIRALKPKQAKTADEPKIRPLKPPPGLLDGGSVVSSPRSPMAGRGAMWSPRRRSRVGSGVDFDPFAAALLEATKAPSPSPLGGKDDRGSVAPAGSPPKKPATRTASRSRSAGWRKWRLSDLLLFRSSSDGGRVNKQEHPDMKPVQQFNVPVKKASAQPAMMIKASAKGDDMGKEWKQHGNRNAAAAADSVAGCARLSPLQRLAKGLGAYSWHHHGMAPPANQG
ncbi:hypothetical protein BDA96_10G101600 [Sorghum bicolor]|uniref:Uncharacterized protein n=1 Tax=Sorghum bicolor TaxID=4558 RepID=A0A921U092_SORBI|nr:hypothetical protein BDA96_10G101600 [Sorghum bicolor]